jgi:hypothetical protein
LNTTLTPHSIIHGDACFAYFNKIWGIPLGVNFQEVVHSVLAGNADVARQSDSRRTEWTCTRMRA